MIDYDLHDALCRCTMVLALIATIMYCYAITL